MILHSAIFAWADGATDADISRLETDLHAFAGSVEGVVSYETARDGGFRDGAADFAIVAKFVDEPALRRYLGHPEHHRILDAARGLVARKESVQAEIG